MLLKCRYLSQFSMADVSSNAANISKAMEKCPFMMHVRRSLATSTSGTKEVLTSQENQETTTSNNALENQLLKEASKVMTCTNSINCPFFQNGNINLNNLIVKKNLEDSNETNQKMATTISTKRRANENMENLENKKPHCFEEANSNKPLFDYEKFFGDKISAKKKDGSYRQFKKVIRHAQSFPKVQEHTRESVREITIWCSNDYLGLGRHPFVQSEVKEAVNKYGTGSGGTRNISGSTPLHDKLEKTLAQLHQKPAALVFTSCYVANDTTLFTMAKMLPNCHILSDAGNHASMIQGIRNSGIPKTVFRHNDVEHLEEVLAKLPRHIPKIVAFESVHSMDGSIADIEKMCDVSHKYGGITFVDEVHAVGLYGENGGGVGERDNLLHKMDIITGTLGKAFGNIGGYIAGSENFVDTMRSYGAGFIFTTSLPPSVAAGAVAAIQVSASDEGRALRHKHQMYAREVKQRLMAAGLPVMNSPSHIVPVMVGNVEKANEICNRLLTDHGIYIQAINYPTVARGEERLRIVPNPHHTAKMIDDLVESLVDVWQKTGLGLLHKTKKI